jgi:hypothetical protein
VPCDTDRFSVGSPWYLYDPRLFAMRPFSCNTLVIPNVPFVVLYIRCIAIDTYRSLSPAFPYSQLAGRIGKSHVSSPATLDKKRRVVQPLNSYLIYTNDGESYHRNYGEYGAMSNAISRLGTRITSAITTGRNPIQHIVISCSLSL